jgi:hypothetical protein
LLDPLHSPPPTQLPILDLVREVFAHLVMPQHLTQLQSWEDYWSNVHQQAA